MFFREEHEVPTTYLLANHAAVELPVEGGHHQASESWLCNTQTDNNNRVAISFYLDPETNFYFNVS